MKNHDQSEAEKISQLVKQIENMVGDPAFDIQRHEDVKVNVRVSESVAPAMFKPDPLIPGGYIANSLTVRAMKPDIFVMGDSFEDLFKEYGCACGKVFDIQFWKLCPYCGRDIKC